MFKVVKNLPIPEAKKITGSKGRTSIYPFGEMEIGDCMKFEASSVGDSMFKKVYNSAMSHARRHSGDYKFTFAEIKPGVFGCWKVKLKSGEERPKKRKRRTNAEIMSVKHEDIREALKKGVTIAGAAKIVDLNPRTFLKLKRMYEKVGNTRK